MRHRKLFACILLSGIVLTGTAAASSPQAVKYILTKADYPVIVGQSKAQLELPLLNYEGHTYVALKDLDKLTGTQAKWNPQKNQIEINELTTFVSPDEYSSPESDWVTIINKQLQSINNQDEKTYWTLFTPEGKRNVPEFPQKKVIATFHYEFRNVTDTSADVLVDSILKVDGELRPTQAQYNFVKTGGSWKIGSFEF
ncbi:hypothetical protein [Gorillibacterium massiliense]|uniref:hypothetical protein n=1 Tax=Gorillibacterium massiliense TaxID=1280390 RepID=UPI0004B8724F|nr:hypothetical protein [Gorillibacterium massiliense]